jgi:hypothetical protein
MGTRCSSYAEAVTVCTPYKFPEYGTVRNAGPQVDGGICAAAATVNSFAYLINHYPNIYGGSNLIPDVNNNGILDLPDLDDARDKLARGWAAAGNGAGGIYGERYTDLGNGQWDPAETYGDLNGNDRWDPYEPLDDANGNGRWDPEEKYDDANGDGQWDPGEPWEDLNGKWDPGEWYDDFNNNGQYDGPDSADGDECWWVNKLWWIDDHAPGTTVFDGQVQGSINPQNWLGGAVLEDKYPTWEFLWDELMRCEDVEIGIVRKSGSGGHVLTLTQLCFVDNDGDSKWDPLEVRVMRFMDPNGVPTERTAMLWEGVDDRFEFNWWQDKQDWFIQTAFTESPVPEPLTLLGLFLASGCTGIYIRRWRKL